MAVLLAYRSTSALFFDNANLSKDIAVYGTGDPAWPPALQQAARKPAVTLSRVMAAANGRAIQALRARAYSDDFYHRVHVTPAELALGNVASSQVTTVSVWNAWLKPNTIQSVAVDDTGVQITPPAALPMALGALQETSWLVNVTPDGPSVIDALVRWTLTTGVAALHITGNRIVTWGFAPDWSSPITERLAWLTDVLQSPLGGEQRRALRIAPRRSFAASMLVEGRERAFFDLARSGWGARVWAVPVWHDVQQLAADLPAASSRINCDVSQRDFRAGGLALLRGDTAFDTEAVEILAIDATGLQLKRPTQQLWRAGTALYPIRTARIAEFDSTRLTDMLTRAQVTFDLAEPSDWPAALPATLYRGRPVFEQRPDESEDLSVGYERLLLTLDNGTSLPAVTDTASRNFGLQQHRWLLAGRAESAAWRSLVYGLRGRAKSVWVPTHANDFTLTKPAAGSLLTVERVGYSRFGVGTQGRRDIRIELVNGTVIYRRITAATEGASTEDLSLDSDLPSAINPADVGRISYMALCRLADDTVELEHLTDAEGVTRAAITWRGVRDDLENV